MRWNLKEEGDTKVRKFFALLPIVINNEARWLEWVRVRYRLHYNWAEGWSWRRERFIDN